MILPCRVRAENLGLCLPRGAAWVGTMLLGGLPWPHLGEQGVPSTPLTQCSHSWVLGVHGYWGSALCQMSMAP